MKVILHPSPPESEDGVWVVYPVENCGLSLEEIALKDVPAGLPFIFADSKDLPPLRMKRAWIVDFSNPDGFGKGPDAWFAERDAREHGNEPNPS